MPETTPTFPEALEALEAAVKTLVEYHPHRVSNFPTETPHPLVCAILSEFPLWTLEGAVRYKTEGLA